VANQIPLSGASNEAGAYLFRDDFGELLIDAINVESAVMQLARVDRLSARRKVYAVDVGDPTVAFVDESEDKPVTGAEFGQMDLNVKKLAAIVIYTEEMLEDAISDPRVLINRRLAQKFALKIDAHALGMEDGAVITGEFDDELVATTTATTDLGTGGDAFALAVSQAIELVEANGYDATGIIAARDVKASLRDARATVETATPVYTAGFNREPDTLYGLRMEYTKNLDAFPAGANKVAAVVGDWSHAIIGIRKDLTMRVSTEATVTVGGTPRNLWQKNEVAALWEMRVGFAVHDLNAAFAKIPNGS
jgi:HK97 family phage major capsid protein